MGPRRGTKKLSRQAANDDLGAGGIRLGQLRGIEIRLHPSLAVIFALIVFSLGSGLFQEWHPGWSNLLRWTTAFAAGVLFFGSLLAHELAHSLVAQARDIRVPRITLFVFGGMARLEREPDTPGTELLIAVAGPVTSLALGLTFTALGVSLAPAGFEEGIQQHPEAALAGLGPIATLLLWLGPINLMLGVFNLVPGFPLDGGRVFRALLWWRTGSFETATRWAVRAGRGFALLLMGFGIFQALGGGIVGGLWLVLIGWFLANAARASLLELAVRKSLDGLLVADIMRTHFETTEPDRPLIEFSERYLQRSEQRVWPVVCEGAPVGFIFFGDVEAVPEAERRRLNVRDVMRPIDRSVAPAEDANDVLPLMAEGRPVAVTEDRRLVGLLQAGDVARWLALHSARTA